VLRPSQSSIACEGFKLNSHLYSRPTVKLSRRREQGIAERERAPASSKTEDRPDYAGRLQRLLGPAQYSRYVCATEIACRRRFHSARNTA
jgi:hypothetical protein